MEETAHASVLEWIDLKHLNREDAEEIVPEGPEAIIWPLLQLAVMAQANRETLSQHPLAFRMTHLGVICFYNLLKEHESRDLYSSALKNAYDMFRPEISVSIKNFVLDE